MDTGSVLGFDVGTRMIGVAIGTALTGTARPLTTLTVTDRGVDWGRVDALLKEWRPVAAVVGLPLTLGGESQSMTKTATEFADGLALRSGLPVHRIDERNSSREAAQRFAQRRAQGSASRKQAAHIDAIAAAVILDRWFDQHSSGSFGAVIA